MHTFFEVFAILFIALGVQVWLRMLLSHLITHACNEWWKARESYRKRMDSQVEDLVDDTALVERNQPWN
jgi:hypothetical protein